MNPVISSLTSGGYSLPGVNSQVFNYLLNPQSTNLSQVGGALSSFYGNEMNNGMSQSTMNAAYNQNQVNNQQNINSIMNQLGPNANAGSIMNQLSMNGMQSNAMLGSQLASQSQAIKQQGAAGVGTTATALDSQTMQMLMSALTSASGESTTGLSALQNIFGTSTSSATSLTGSGAQLQDQEGSAWESALSGLAGGAVSLGSMSSMGINPFSGLSELFGGGSGGSSMDTFSGDSPYSQTIGDSTMTAPMNYGNQTLNSGIAGWS
jgi:hypothetical protein